MKTRGIPVGYRDPKERVDLGATGAGWIMGSYMKIIAKYLESVKKYPNPPASNITNF